jgi:hypothetical protein
LNLEGRGGSVGESFAAPSPPLRLPSRRTAYPWRPPCCAALLRVAPDLEPPAGGGTHNARHNVPTEGDLMEAQDFLDRLFKNIPAAGVSTPFFKHWSVPGKPTDEAVMILSIPGADPEKIIQRVMDVDHYVGNVDHVKECRSIADPAFQPPGKVRFYQKVDVPMLASVQHELALVDGGEMHGYRVGYWYLLKDRTDALNPKNGARSQFNVGAWLAKPGIVGYALSSAPKREDVNFLQWKALTSGADVMAEKVIKANIEGMARWAARR